MRQHNLERAVARATGDDLAFIRNRGFSIVEDASALNDDDLEEIIRDWERIQNEMIEHEHTQPQWTAAVARAPHNKNLRARRRQSRAGYSARSTKAAN